jgi:aminoglycoside phosphotransferase (APT) family kinase protein
MLITVQTSSPGNIRATSAPCHNILEFLSVLFKLEQVEVDWHHSPVRTYLAECTQLLRIRGEKSAAQLIERASEYLAQGLGPQTHPHGLSHGDFVPWNLRISRHPFVFDWEWCQKTLPLYDLYHYSVFPRLKTGGQKSISAAIRLIDSAQMRARALRVFPTALPNFNTRLWLVAYVAHRYAFYCETTSAASRRLTGEPSIGAYAQLLKILLEGR